jgi:glycosyltransferase involved in cell wall biosynthesis
VTPRVSIVVPLHRYGDVARRCVETTLALCGDAHELLVVSDAPIPGLPAGVREIHTGSATDTSPAEKRDAAMAHVRGDICAFLDDDAWPREDWLHRAVARFDADPSVAAIGGPGITPPGSGFRERAGGAFYESPLGSASLRNRFAQVGEAVDTEDWPAFNFFVRTDVLEAVGGWASRFYGGEDTKLCLMLVEAGHRIVADPELVVFHARRPIFASHMRQVGNVGRHRGWFVHKFPRTSAKPVYFAPALALVFGPLLAAWGLLGGRTRRRATLATGILGWAAISGHAVRRGTDVDAALVLPATLAAGHGAYGAGFIEGLLFTDEIDAM